ncbi:membrane-bound serine protease (ClpP class) [Crenobacter luteus]|uniref:NfeD family protein n=1 Tax=Crenobacter luteus TaxID=1452487 RepID=UPI0010D18F3D|nr:nodulation protein NfeD [Crenobacter luteus]TCP13101.1 membrane-bound serine protease (ClpP class) [Crenobacter luteus]
MPPPSSSSSNLAGGALWRLCRLLLICGLALLLAGAGAAPRGVVLIPLQGAIGPARADFVERGLVHAREAGAALVVLQMDTPGGLDVAMRQIIQAILASPVPVATFIAPSGSRAASAGTYILYASHIAAMAPGTNLGAATPVQVGIGGGPERQDGKADKRAASEAAGETQQQTALEKKQVNDAAAYIRGLAQLRGRNADWAERAVREAVSLSADEARAEGVIDLVARDVPELLRQLDGREVDTAAGRQRLDTRAATLSRFDPDWRDRLLAALTDPSIALILMMIGLYGLFFEFSNPGFVLPGVVGAICLLIGLFALQLLPINYTGLALLLFGLACLLAEAFLPSFGILGIGGIVAFSIGALLLVDTDVPGLGVPVWLVAALAASTALFVFGVSGLALKARKRPVVSGAEGLAASTGVMLEAADGDEDGFGWASVQGERWRVRSERPLPPGTPVRVTGRDGLTLTVAPLDDTQGADR